MVTCFSPNRKLAFTLTFYEEVSRSVKLIRINNDDDFSIPVLVLDA